MRGLPIILLLSHTTLAGALRHPNRLQADPLDTDLQSVGSRHPTQDALFLTLVSTGGRRVIEPSVQCFGIMKNNPITVAGD